MQQKLAVASVLLLALLAGLSAFMILSNGFGQAKPAVNVPSQTSQPTLTATTITNSTSTSALSTSAGGSLLTTTTATHTSEGDD